jgi:DNA-binding response OmpR family regulator
MLASGGHEVTLAANGSEGILAYRRHPPDVVITDLVMPDKEGFETIADLRREHPGARIVAMSGGGRISGSSYLATARLLGVGALLPKPFDTRTLLAAVDGATKASEPDGNETPKG